LAEKFTISSSISDDIWHDQKSPKAYEWWYFDALSDDGRDAIVVIFLDNFIFSPRYHSVQTAENRFPAIAFTYYRDGKPRYRAINEFYADEFEASSEIPFCKIGANEMTFVKAPYGSGYSLNIDVLMHKNRRLTANLEWLLVESDFLENVSGLTNTTHNWNLVAPRCDVTGKIEVFRRNGKQRDNIQFRGTGYHDHNFDSRDLTETVSHWIWGRVHFADISVVYYQYVEKNSPTPVTKLFVVENGELSQFDASYKASKPKRDIFGLNFQQLLEFETEKGHKLSVNQSETIDASFFYLRFLSKFTMRMPDGKSHEMTGISEQLSPNSLQRRWLHWLIDMRIGRSGNGAFLP
jgi:carotenoid 1,2-hydratase